MWSAQAAWNAVKAAARPRVHVFLATSPIHMQFKLNMTEDQVVANSVKTVQHLRSLGCQDIEFSPEDATRWGRRQPGIVVLPGAPRALEWTFHSARVQPCYQQAELDTPFTHTSPARRRSEPRFLYRVLEEVIKAGATTVNIPDTTGWALPHEFGGLIADLKANTPGIDDVIISTHCQNDLGLSTANSLAGAQNGARQVPCRLAVRL